MAVWDENPANTMQKYIDNFLKYVQTNIDITYGENNDNSDEPLKYNNIPIAFQGTCIKTVSSSQISGPASNNVSGSMYFKYDILISQNGDSMISNMELLGGSSALIGNLDNTYYHNLWVDFDSCTFTCSIKSELIDGYMFLPRDSHNNNNFDKQYHILKNDYDYTNITDTTFEGYSTTTGNQLYIEPWNVEYTITEYNSGNKTGHICTVNSHGRSVPNCTDKISIHMATTHAPSIMFTDNTTVVNNYTTYGGNTYNDNDTYNNIINTYYGDNYIVVSPVSSTPDGGLGFDFNDLVNALTVAVGDINAQFGYDIVVPSYDDIKYRDMGSFYITPIKQIDKLPTAPDVGDTYPDFSNYLSIVGGAVTSFYNMVDGLGVSLMLVFTFLICLVINHLKKG